MVTITHDHAARKRSYELLAAEFGLSGQGAADRETDALAAGERIASASSAA